MICIICIICIICPRCESFFLCGHSPVPLGWLFLLVFFLLARHNGDVGKLKSREAKNVAEILELAPTFRSLADAYAANTAGNVVGALETGGGGSADTEGGAGFSRLAVGLAVRQVGRADDMFSLLRCSSAWHNPPIDTYSPLSLGPPTARVTRENSTKRQQQQMIVPGTLQGQYALEGHWGPLMNTCSIRGPLQYRNNFPLTSPRAEFCCRQSLSRGLF